MDAKTPGSVDSDPANPTLRRVVGTIPLHLQILGGFLSLHLGVLLGTLVIVNQHQTAEVRRAAERQLEVTKHVFLGHLKNRETQWSREIALLSKDFAIGRALATRDPETIRSVATNLRERIGADFVWFTDPAGRLIAGAPESAIPALPEDRQRAGAAATSAAEGASILLVNERLHQIAGAAMEMKGLDTRLVVGLAVDDRFVADVKRIAHCDLSLFAGGRLAASTLPPDARDALAADLSRETSGSFRDIRTSAGRFGVLPLPLSGDARVYLHQGLDEALRPLAKLRTLLIAVGLAGLLISAFLGYVLAERVTGSIQSLIARLRRSNEDLSQLNEFKERLFAMVLHDVNNPLTAVRGSLEILQMKLGKIPEDKAARFIETALSSAQRVARIISDLVDFAAIEAGQLSVNRVPLNLLDVVRDVHRRMEVLSAKSNVRISLEEASEPLFVSGDPHRLNQALQNLCSNALHYTPAGGAIRVTVRRVDDQAQVSVSDTGIGIAEADLPHIFERFYQAANAKAIRRGGFGLGLRIVQEIVDIHGGRINVTSAVGKGSTFTVVLPLAKEAGRAATASQAA